MHERSSSARPKARPSSAPSARPPAPGARRGRPQPRPAAGTLGGRTVSVLPRADSVLRMLARRGTGAIGAVLLPSELGDGTSGPQIADPRWADPKTREEVEREIVEAFAGSPAPEPVVVSPRMVEVTPRRGDVIITPDVWVDPRPLTVIPNPLEVVEIETIPEVEAPPPVGPAVRPPPAQRSGLVPTREVVTHFEFSPDGSLRIRPRVSTSPKWTQRARDRKYDRFYRRALGLVNNTWGTLSELGDVVSAFLANTYAFENGRRVSALAVERGNVLGVFAGVGRGEYSVDMVGFAADVAVQQITDELIGRTSRGAQDALNAAGYNRPVGFGAGPAL